MALAGARNVNLQPHVDSRMVELPSAAHTMRALRLSVEWN